MAISMAIGFLFMGAGAFSFGSSPAAIAALVISLYPHLPGSTSDNRYHLQPLRHFWALAAEPRSIDVLDVDTKEPVPPARLGLAVGTSIVGPNYWGQTETVPERGFYYVQKKMSLRPNISCFPGENETWTSPLQFF